MPAQSISGRGSPILSSTRSACRCSGRWRSRSVSWRRSCWQWRSSNSPDYCRAKIPQFRAEPRGSPHREKRMTKAASIDVGALIEGQTLGRFQIGLMAWICTFMLIEGYDMQVVGYAAPAIIKAWHSDKAAFGVVFGAGLAGFMLGATVLGNFGDRFGRKRMIVAGSLLFGLFTLASAWADGLTSLLVLRTIAGVGLGGSIPNAIALVTEYSPLRERATRVGIMFIGYTVGSAVGGIIAAHLIPNWGW